VVGDVAARVGTEQPQLRRRARPEQQRSLSDDQWVDPQPQLAWATTWLKVSPSSSWNVAW
jgi:hypothetical protein